MPKKLRCELLCEDIAQEQFFRPILEHLFDRVRVTRGAQRGGFTFVLAQAPKSAAYIRRFYQEAVGLLIAIDGDVDGLQNRLRQIRAALEAKGLDPKALEQRLAVCVPTRSIETLILWFQGRRDLDEQMDVKRQAKDKSDHRQVANQWFSFVSEDQKAQEAAQLPSLAHGRQEIDRLKGAAKN